MVGAHIRIVAMVDLERLLLMSFPPGVVSVLGTETLAVLTRRVFTVKLASSDFKLKKFPTRSFAGYESSDNSQR